MRDPAARDSPSLRSTLRQLAAHDHVSLPGASSDVVVRWLKRRNVMFGIALGVIALGTVVMVAGYLLREIGAWAVLIPGGFFLAFAGVVSMGVVGLQSRLIGGRLQAEKLPVVLDPRGIILRGIGPIPWTDVEPPEHRHIRVKNDIGGQCTVMPLTARGRVRVNEQIGWWKNRVGPKPYLRADIPYLLLPGIDGLTEDETLQLFRIAQRRYVR